MAGSLEGNKIIAAVLTAGIIGAGSGVVARMLYAPEIPHEHAFKVEVTEEAAPAAEQTAAVEPIAVRLAAADAAKGEAAVKVCSSCHNFEKGAANKVGPNLWGVVDADIGAHEGYSYSTALQEKEGAWSYDSLDQFLTAPKAWAPGTKMSYAGISNPAQRADIIAYLRSLADNPAPLPAPQG